MRPISFSIEKETPGSFVYPDQGEGARAGVLHTPHGDIKTPAFVAVATKANLKGIPSTHFKDLGVQGIIANTYHLYLSGLDAIEKAGGVGKFMGFDGPVMTDSGGFQVFSLGVGFGKKISKFSKERELPEQNGLASPAGETKSDLQDEENRGPFGKEVPAMYDEDLATSHGKLAIIDEEGVSFTSHLDGSFHRFTPERSIEIQHRLGADIIYAFDECTAPTADWDYQKEAADRTHRWAKRSLVAHRYMSAQVKPAQFAGLTCAQGIYGIVQGGRFEDLRIDSAKTIAAMDFDGFGIGGSFSKHDILGILDKVNHELPKEKPRHLLGIGEPEDIFIGVAAGIDTFDCVLPTRNGRNGGIYTTQGKIQIPNAEYREDFTALDVGCECVVCINYTRAYIHHLFRTKEMLGQILASMHNVYFLTNLTKKIRESILDGSFERYRDAFLSTYKIR